MPDIDARLAAALADRYRIEREIGAGGMATVYLAHDVRHDRKVALKVLRPELAAVIGADRFLAEIHTTAALQHPHILPLFDSGQVNGFLFYVMPYVEGESLRDRLKREHQLPVDDAVRIGKEVLSALDYAHRHGVIHRDIKPENILLHDGQAQVADFGIALAVSQAGGNRMTETGLSLGTPGYMSPEQATGERTLDARSDVYSVACLIYEMLTGAPPHTGATMQAVIAAVVTKDPERLSAQRKMVPPQLEAAVHKALAKLPADRFATAEAFSRALSEPISAQAAAMMTAGFAPMPEGRQRRVTYALAGAVVALAALAAWGWLRPRHEPQLERYALYLNADASLGPALFNNSTGRVTISRDGQRIILVGRSKSGSTRLFLKNRGDVDPAPIGGTDGAYNPFFSPDGRTIGFLVNGTLVRVLPLDGGTALTLYDKANTSGGDWGDDDYIYFETDSTISRMRSGGGTLETVYQLDAKQREIGAEFPQVLPGATGVIFRVRAAGQAPGDFTIVGVPLPRGTPKVITRGLFATYAVSGHLIVVTRDGKLVAFPFDPRKLELTGPPAALYENLEARPFAAPVAVSRTGTLVFVTSSQSAERDLAYVTRDGIATKVDPAWDPQGQITSLSLSPNGKQLALTLLRATTPDIWVKQVPTGPFVRITFGDSAFTRAQWTHDGKNLVFIGGPDISGGAPFMKQADGVGSLRLLSNTRMNLGEVLQSPDGKWTILRRVLGEPGNGDIFGIKDGDTTVVPLVATPAREGEVSISPNGKWMAYASDETGQYEVYVRPFPAVASARWQVSTAGGQHPVWAHSGREIFYRDGKDSLVAAAISESPTFTVGAQKPLFTLAPYPATSALAVYAPTPDDKHFYILRQSAATTPSEVIVTENWFGELRAKTEH